ncbi:CBS domain-containing protein [Streptomyces sp. DSM 44917]|uniref:CBS domain-containing protein n=1 Tax=Streptomyces boetiae TaxID=3075541 RepID=A0ABU2LDY3_9ACTN|nr:CBS domain-containing protein [Streptomyces sp. DSM 44917]MDT0309783.1 CBS domain-containing protein [Streptomyces sp. DSM 44917]
MKQRMVGTVMTGDVVRAAPGTPLKDIAGLLAEHRISGLPVVDDDERVLGVVSEADLMARQAWRGERRGHRRLFRARGRAARGRGGRDPGAAGQAAGGPPAWTAAELMSAPAITVRATDPLAKAARTMADHRVKRLPVLDEEDRLVGIVSRRDVVGVFLRPDAEIRAEIEDRVLVRSLWLPAGAVEVTVTDGVVTLDGAVERLSEIAIAVRLTAQTDGVVDVVERLAYSRDDTPLSPGEAWPGGTADGWRHRS